ncbi:hypothetical protein CASFOL_018201 [Castilleja foliolosa]|uniref:Uncharacterized protein n=1 Tax=Castilleja foliolosa TaxID=1961234 RepID=A0ABD3D625_9LAMI
MGGETFWRRSSSLSGCMSPSCVPVHEEYSRIHTANQDKTHRNRRLRKLLRRIVDEGTCIYGPAPKHSTFQYDAVSYSQNFDDGCHRDETAHAPYQRVSLDLKWRQEVVHNK